MLQNHDITKTDAQQTFRLMHYFAVEGKTFPSGFPRVYGLPNSVQRHSVLTHVLLFGFLALQCSVHPDYIGRDHRILVLPFINPLQP